MLAAYALVEEGSGLLIDAPASGNTPSSSTIFRGKAFSRWEVETTIEGKKCFSIADNFFHHDQISGTGGWRGPQNSASDHRNLLLLLLNHRQPHSKL